MEAISLLAPPEHEQAQAVALFGRARCLQVTLQAHQLGTTHRTLPRSTGREDFGEAYLAGLLDAYGGTAPADLVASAVEVAARAIAAVANEAGRGVTEIVLTGGGALHPGLFGRVRELADPLPVLRHELGPLAPLHHEPAAMALIAARTLHRRPCGLPGVTGAHRPAILGHVYWPST